VLPLIAASMTTGARRVTATMLVAADAAAVDP